jgi:hypothetical protein
MKLTDRLRVASKMREKIKQEIRKFDTAVIEKEKELRELKERKMKVPPPLKTK